MKRLPLVLLILSACAKETAYLPEPGIWKKTEVREEPVLAREFGLIRVLVAAPQFTGDAVMLRVFVANRTSDLVIADTADLVLIEPGGNPCRNEAKQARVEISGVGEELVVGEFALRQPSRSKAEGFTIKFKVTPYAPTEQPAVAIEFKLRPR